MIITGERQLRQLVQEYQQHDALVFDLETMYVPTEEEAERTLASTSARSCVDGRRAWINVFDLKATDPHRHHHLVRDDHGGTQRCHRRGPPEGCADRARPQDDDDVRPLGR